MSARSILKEYIALVLEKVSPPDGPRDGEFGKYVFASRRNDVPDPPEEDTPEETDVASALEKHFHGRHDDLQKWINTLVANREKYQRFLKPPQRATRAYRTLTVPSEILEMIVGKRLTKDDYDGEVKILSGGKMPGKFKGRTFFSWTLQPEIIHGLKKTWGSLFHTNWIRNKMGEKGFVVVVSADLKGNMFLLNPDMIKKTGLAGEFDYQVEVLSVGDVELSDVAYFYFDENTPEELESELIDQCISVVKVN
jgi:hypothetical protein